MSGPISSIYNRGQAEAPSPEVAEQRRKEAGTEAWRRHGIVMLRLDDVLDDWIRQAIRNEAERLYGRRDGQE